jgi:hypothetical protein
VHPDNMVVMNVWSMIGYVLGSLGIISAVAAAVVVARSSTTRAIAAGQKDLIELQDKKLTLLQAQFLDSSNKIADLQGQVSTLRDMPLKEIAADLKIIAAGMQTMAADQKLTAAHQDEITRMIRSSQPMLVQPAGPATNSVI